MSDFCQISDRNRGFLSVFGPPVIAYIVVVFEAGRNWDRGLDWMRFLEEHQAKFVVQSRRSEMYVRCVREVGPSEEED